MWGLSKEAALTVINKHDPTQKHLFVSDKELLQTTLRHVYEEGEKPCVDLTHYEDDLSFRMVPEPKWRKRFDCFKCREELKQEAGC